MEYDLGARVDRDQYGGRLERGWRRFGRNLFRPNCPECAACRSLRVDVAGFRPDRSQRRVRRANEGEVQPRLGRPSLTPAKLALFDRFHAHHVRTRGWPDHEPGDLDGYRETFLDNPFATEEWSYELEGRLVGLGYVDAVPDGLSAIYFVHDPEQGRRSLGTWNVLSIIEEAALRGLPRVYLGYFVADCESLAYKARFVPNQVRGPGGTWADFRP